MSSFQTLANRDVILSGLSVVGLMWYIGLWSIGLLGCWTAYVPRFCLRLDVEQAPSRKRYRLRPRSPLATAPRGSVPGVSILRPLKGLDTNLYENLESTFTQQYPHYEIIFSVADDHDQSLSVVRDLISKHPNINAKLIVGMRRVEIY